MFGATEMLMLFVPLIYIAAIGFVFWLGLRFVKAFESMAESLKKIVDREK